jgi:parvulin-like peptidyl-prolyl isomerase
MKTTARQATGHRTKLGRAAVAMMIAGLFACGRRGAAPGEGGSGASGGAGAGATPTPEPGVMATIGGDPIPYKSFERYLVDNGMDDTGGGDQDDVIKSHLLDQFLEEQLMLRAARGLKIAVSEAEIDAYLQQIGVSEGEADVAGPEGKEGFRDKVRQELIIQKVKDASVLSKVQVTPGEVDDYIKKQPELQKTSRRVVLRQILVDDKSLADRLRATLAADPSRFEAVARESSVASDRGQARGYDEEELPVELRAPLFALEPGQVSPVIENAQRYLIFQIVQKAAPREADPKEIRRTVQLKLFQQKSEQALERYVADLRKETEVRVNRSVLQFNYTGEYK